MNNQDYAGFWIRVGASIIDTILIMVIIIPIVMAIYGPAYWTNPETVGNTLWGILLNYILPAVAVILFWIYRSATPGKMALGLVIVDEKTGEKPSTKQFIGRYLSYYVSMIPLFIGMFWVAFDKKKQGWHDKLAGTLVIRQRGS